MTSPAVKKLSLNTDDCEEDDDSLVNEDEENQLNEQSLSSSGVTSSSERSATGESSNQDAKELKEIIRSEEKAVLKTKAVLALAILCCAIAVTVAVYFLTLRNDLNRFEVEYEAQVTEIKKMARWEIRYNFALMEQLSASITIAALHLNNTFPFHTDPMFEIPSGFVDGMGGIMSAAFAPFVTLDQLDKWSDYSVENQGWIEESAYLQKVHPIHRDAMHGTFHDHEHDRRRRGLQEETLEEKEATEQISPKLFHWENGQKVQETAREMYAPLWQISPANYININNNLLADPRILELYRTMLNRNKGKRDLGVLSSHTKVQELFDFLYDEDQKHMKQTAHAIYMQPVYDKIAENSNMIGFTISLTSFGNFLDYILGKGQSGIVGVLKDNCNNILSFELSDRKTTFLGYADMHDKNFDKYERVEYDLEMYGEYFEGSCSHDLYIYPTQKRKQLYETDKPIVYTMLVAVAFGVTILLFVLYDFFVTRRQNKTVLTALKTQKIVTSLFPKEIGRRIISQAQEASSPKTVGKTLSKDADLGTNGGDRIAQFYPDATVIFADLAGFTAWSSMREPDAAFTLLESLYNSFDKIASRRRVFKVETVGDCYMAVCGVPAKRKNHHVIASRFAVDILQACGPILAKLEVSLGPDTAELGIRIGLSSGPITAGVLRGDRARFQLFGDTVNTAARMESTGAKNKIHISKLLATKLIADGKEHWVMKRQDLVSAKGKGELETYWLQPNRSGENTSTTGSSTTGECFLPTKQMTANLVAKSGMPALSPKQQRLVEWNTDILTRLLRFVLTHRQAAGIKSKDSQQLLKAEKDLKAFSDRIAMDELQDVIELPHFDPGVAEDARKAKPVEVSPKVANQLREYVTVIAGLYRDNYFHSFEHCSHVCMSVSKLMGRIVATDAVEGAEELHDYTFGITSDPLTQFAVVFVALIHDVDHQGVSNIQLFKEESELSKYYRGKSIAEQNSIDIAWDVLMQDCFVDLRHAIYSNEQELKRFRQLLVNIVLATDIADKELKAARNDRWAKAFSGDKNPSTKKEDSNLAVNRKATIVLEHIIQASDVAHTMQHWHIYKKWNQRLFLELYAAHKAGRLEAHPATFWAKGEIGFFDYYIIPLAEKLGECGVFGVSGDEYLTYALANRTEWDAKGEAVVAEYMAEIEAEEKQSLEMDA